MPEETKLDIENLFRAAISTCLRTLAQPQSACRPGTGGYTTEDAHHTAAALREVVDAFVSLRMLTRIETVGQPLNEEPRHE